MPGQTHYIVGTTIAASSFLDSFDTHFCDTMCQSQKILACLSDIVSVGFFVVSPCNCVI